MTLGCLYVDKDGETVEVLVGDSFHNGCNECSCRKGGRSKCSKVDCRGKCPYLNHDKIVGYAEKGSVRVFNSGREEICKCKMKKRGKRPRIAKLSQCTPVRSMVQCVWNTQTYSVDSSSTKAVLSAAASLTVNSYKGIWFVYSFTFLITFTAHFLEECVSVALII